MSAESNGVSAVTWPGVSLSSTRIWVVKAFSFSGRFSVIVAMPSATS